MKKTFRMVGAAALCAVLMPALSSCGSDDDDEPNGGPDIPGIEEEGPSGVSTPVRLTSIGGVNIYYDDKGRVERIGNYVEIDYSKGTIGLEDGEMDIKFNGKGYVSEISGSWDYGVDDGRAKGSGKMKFTYNGSGNLVRCNSSSNETYYEDGYKYSYSETFTMDAEWKDGNLEKIEATAVEKEDGETDRDYMVTTYAYGNQINKYYQMPIALSYGFFDDEEISVLAAAGLFGIGSKYLPSALAEVEDSYTDSYRISYTLNDNGSIAREYFDNSAYNWNYSEITRGAFDAAPAKKADVRSIFVNKGRFDRK